MKQLVFIGIGDIHGGAEAARGIPGIADAEGIIVSGDLTNYGGPAEVRAVVDGLRAINPRVLAQIGNMDKPEADAWLSQAGVNLHRRVVELAPGLKAVGLGYSTPTPFGTPSEVPDAVLAEWLAALEKRLGEYARLLLVSHTPPFDTACDRIGSGAHVGSTAVRAFIERLKPDVCLTGHIHESHGMDRVGPTLVINPGALGAGGYARIVYDGQGLWAELPGQA